MRVVWSEVSIPQSEFCPLGQAGAGLDVYLVVRFNSSVGILSVGTRRRMAFSYLAVGVSIPQSEFCPLGRGEWPALAPGRHGVSIPQSEFCPLGLTLPSRYLWLLTRSKFQFLSRNSVRWDLLLVLWMGKRSRVSIPQSEFCPLGRVTYGISRIDSAGFNSSVGILSVGTR